jgi:hypothetical protein
LVPEKKKIPHKKTLAARNGQPSALVSRDKIGGIRIAVAGMPAAAYPCR